MVPFILETSLKPDASFAFTATVVVAGLFIVLLTLAALIVIFSLFSRLVVALEQRADKKKKVKTEAPAAQPNTVRSADDLPLPPPIEEGIRPEIVAVITAAIAAAEGENAVVTSIKRAPKRMTSGESAWANAATWQNTRPF